MIYDVVRLSKDYPHSDDCEQHLSELLYAHGILPKPIKYSKGNCPGWDVAYDCEGNRKAEIKIQSREDLCFELFKVQSGKPCGVKTTESFMYIMINRHFTAEYGEVGTVRVVYVDDIINHINKMGNKLRIVTSHQERVTFVDPKHIPCIDIGYVKCLDYGDRYDASEFTPI